jgi:hypothetical protein
MSLLESDQINIFSRLFVSASPLVVAKPKKPRDKKNHNWNATPERLLLKCILGQLVRTGLARKDLLVKFKRLIPDCNEFFDSPVFDGAIWGRAEVPPAELDFRRVCGPPISKNPVKLAMRRGGVVMTKLWLAFRAELQL